jgi:DNA-directed RNA polymerase subunit RPC12/RpoP
MTCTHERTRGKADWAGTCIAFTCVDCGKVVKTVTQESGLNKLPSSLHPIKWDAPKSEGQSNTLGGGDAMTDSIPSNLKGFYHRALGAKGGSFLDNGKPMWNYHKWGDAPETTPALVGRINALNKSEKDQEYAVVRCLDCHAYHNQADWAGTLCPACSGKGILKPILLVKNPVAMKNGEFRKLPKSSSPLWTTQYAVQGTAKLPYVVSHTKRFGTGNTTTDQGWACSCPNFTQHTPRTECKHILKIMMSEGAKPNTPPVAALPDDQQELYQKFLRQQAERGTPAQPAGVAKPLFTTGRRFR